MPSLKKLLSDSVIYGLSSIVGRFLNYLLVPLYTYKIAAATGGYGVVTNIYAYTALLLVILTFGMETTFFYFANKCGKDKYKEVFSTVLGSVGFVGVLFVVLVMLFINPIADTLGYADHPNYLRAMAVVVALDAFQAILFSRLRHEGKAWKFAGLKLGFIVLSMVLNLFVFLVAPSIADKPWMGWFNANDLVGYIFYINLFCTAIITFGFLHELKDFRFSSFSFELLKPMLRYAWPLLLFGIVGILNQVADKILLPFLLPGDEGQIELGKYGACVKIAMLMAIITQAFRYAYEPFVFGMGAKKQHAEDGTDVKESKETQAAATKYFVMFTLLAFLAVMCYMDIFKYLISPDYWEALPAVPIVMVAEIMMGIYFNLSFWYKLTGATWWGAVISAVGCVVLFAVNIIFVPIIGYMACAWGGLAGYGVCVLISYLIGQRKNPVPYPVWTILGYFVLALALFGVTQLVRIDTLGWRLTFNTVMLLIYVAVVAWNEKRLFAGIFGKMKHIFKLAVLIIPIFVFSISATSCQKNCVCTGYNGVEHVYTEEEVDARGVSCTNMVYLLGDWPYYSYCEWR